MTVRWSWAAAVLAASFAGGVAFAATPGAGAPEAEAKVRSGFGNLPLHFEPNQGQTDERVKFTSRGPGYALYLTGDEAVLVSGAGDARSVLRTRLVGAQQATVEGTDKLPGLSNYIRPDHRNTVPQFRRVEQRGVYPGVDLVYYGTQRQLEYDFVVAPGADPRKIRLKIAGADRLEIDAAGNLVLKTKAGKVLQKAPVVFHQDAQGVRQPVAGRFALRGKDEVGFEVQSYDRSRPLTIDPVFAIQNYASYLGGSSNDAIYAIAVDQSGNAYVAGVTQSIDFPTSNATFRQGPTDGFVSKISADGQSLLYSTYLGGSSTDVLNGIAVDSVSGDAYVTGFAGPGPFPSGYQNNGNPHGPSFNDTLLARLDPFGGLAFSGFLATSNDSTGWGITHRGTQTWVAGEVDGGPPAVAGKSKARAKGRGKGQPQIPARGARFQKPGTRAPNGLSPNSDAVVAKVNTYANGAASVEWVDIIGSPATDEEAFAVAADSGSSIYVTGYTEGTDTPSALGFTNAGYQPAPGGAGDGFVAKLSDTGSRDWMTYLGGSGQDFLWALDVDADGKVYVAGGTSSSDFPTAVVTVSGTNGGFPNVPIQSTPQGNGDASVSRLSTDLSSLEWSTYLGGTGYDVAWGIAASPVSYPATLSGPYVVGQTASVDFPVHNPLQDCDPAGSTDAFIARIDDRGDWLWRSTCLGGTATDIAWAVRSDDKDTAYFAGETNSSDFPTHDSIIQAGIGGATDGFVKRLPLVSVVTPNSYPYDNFWARGGRQVLKFVHSLTPGVDQVDIQMSTDGGAFVTSVVPTAQIGPTIVPATNLPLAASPVESIKVDIPFAVPPGPQKIRVAMSGSGGVEVHDENDDLVAGPTFAAVDPFVNPVRPAINQVLSAGSTYLLRLLHNVGPDQKAHLLLSKTGPAGPFTLIPPAQLPGGNPVAINSVGSETFVSWVVPGTNCSPTCVIRAIWDQKPGGGGPGDGVYNVADDFPDPTFSVIPAIQSVYDSPQFTIGGLGINIGAFWKMDEASGNRVDSAFLLGASTYGDDLVPGGSGGVGSTPGKILGAADFDPTYPSTNVGYLTRAGGASAGDLRCSASGLTWAGWVRFDPIGTSTPSSVIIADKSTEYSVRYQKATNTLRFQIRGGATGLRVDAPAGTLANGSFHFVVAWWDPLPAPNGSIHVQIDNGATTSVNTTQTCPTTLTNLYRIGATGSGFLKGSVDAVGLWQRVLSPAERTNLWNAGVGKQLF
jgi:hypothetical protein